MRASEAVALSNDDVWIEQLKVNEKLENVLFIYIEKSKVDQDRIGHTVVIGESSDSQLCPITNYKTYMKLRKRSEYLFHQVGSVKPLSAKTPNSIVKSWLKRINVDSKKYGSHSMRRGGATAAAAKGVQQRLIMRHGNWKTNCVFIYISESIENQLSVSKAIFSS